MFISVPFFLVPFSSLFFGKNMFLILLVLRTILLTKMFLWTSIFQSTKQWADQLILEISENR